VAGVNVARRSDGQLVSFLVPASAAARLVARATGGDALTLEGVRAELARQLDRFQDSLATAFVDAGYKPAVRGHYVTPESQAPWVHCWASTNADARPAPRARLFATSCSTRTSIFVADDLRTGTVSVAYAHAESVSLNAFQFAAFVSQHMDGLRSGGASRRLTRQRCHEDFLASERGPPMRATFCARAYRDFPDLYDATVLAVTQDDDRRALVARLTLSGTSWANATSFARRFYAGLERAP
jgi:hypothetical protein